MSPFSYKAAIDGVEPGGLADRRPELQDCIRGWEPWARYRARLFDRIGRSDAFMKGDVVLLEVGHSTWAQYGYALAVDGVFQTGPAFLQSGPVTAGEHLSEVSQAGLHSRVAWDVEDGGCWFLTVVHGGIVRQAVVYGELDQDDTTSDVVRRLASHLQSVEPDAP